MPMDPEALYRELGQLVAQTPANLVGPGAISAETHRWLGRAAALLAETVGSDTLAMLDQVGFTSASDNLAQDLTRAHNAHRIVAILHRALARAEKNAPAAAQGAFIPAGGALTVFQVIGKVLSEAKRGVLIVDPYMGAKALTDFAPLAPEKISIHLLADSAYARPEILRPATERWVKQYPARPLETRLTAARALHDRLMIVDSALVWALTQSLEHFADRAHASVLRVDADVAEQKIHAYGKLWDSAQKL